MCMVEVNLVKYHQLLKQKSYWKNYKKLNVTKVKLFLFSNNVKKNFFLTLYVYYIVDETGKKIRGKSDGNIKDYDQYGK